MQLTIRLLRETGGRWIADIPELPGVTVYGVTAEEIEHRELPPEADLLRFSIAA